MGLGVDSKALQSSQLDLQMTCFQEDQIALELDKVLCGLFCSSWSSHLGPNLNSCQPHE